MIHFQNYYDDHMFRRALRLLLIAFLFNSMGAHLALIQTLAWAKMAVNFSKRDGIEVSLQKTFDGQHPCALCLKVKKASQESPSLGSLTTQNRLDSAFLSSVPRVGRIEQTWGLLSHRIAPYDVAILPDSPPPKVILS